MFQRVGKGLGFLIFILGLIGLVSLPEDLSKIHKYLIGIKKDDVIIFLLIFSSSFFVISIFDKKLLNYFFTTDPNRPMLKLKPSIYDSQIKWPDKQIRPETQNRNPYQFQLTNNGKSDAMEISIAFELKNINLADVLKETDAFPEYSINNNRLRLDLAKGVSSSSIRFDLQFVALKKIDILESMGKVDVTLPINLLELLSVYNLCQSYKLGAQEMRNLQETFDKISTLFEEKNPEKWDQYYEQKQKGQIIDSPTIEVTLKYKGRHGQTYTEVTEINSIYLVTGKSIWVRHNDSLEFHGGFGIISFENHDEPNSGFYNAMKKLSSNAS